MTSHITTAFYVAGVGDSIIARAIFIVNTKVFVVIKGAIIIVTNITVRGLDRLLRLYLLPK